MSFTAQYFASTMIIVGLSVVVTVIVLQYHHHDPHGGKMPKWVSSLKKRSIMVHPQYNQLKIMSILNTSIISLNSLLRRRKQITNSDLIWYSKLGRKYSSS